MQIKKQWIGLLLLSACSTFYAHEDLTSILRHSDSLATSIQLIEEETKPIESNALLAEQELGRLEMLRGDFARAQSHFEPVVRHYRAKDFTPLLSLDEVAEDVLATTVSNDQSIDYTGSDFERVFAHLYQSMVLLQQNNLEHALVELRALRFAQKKIVSLRTAELIEARQRDPIATFKAHKRVSENLPFDRRSQQHLDSLMARTPSGFINLYAFLYTGAIFEALGMADEAVIDYRQALNYAGENSYIRRSLSDLGSEISDTTERPTDHGRLLLFVESGTIQPRQEIATYLHLSDGIHKITWPVYARYSQPAPVEMDVRLSGSQSRVDSLALIMTTLPLAVDELGGRTPSILMRQLARLFISSAITEIDNLAIQLSSQLLSNVVNRADTRTWLSLPASVHAQRFSLPSGDYQLHLTEGSGFQHEFTITANQTQVVVIAHVGDHWQVIAHHPPPEGALPANEEPAPFVEPTFSSLP